MVSIVLVISMGCYGLCSFSMFFHPFDGVDGFSFSYSSGSFDGLHGV